VTPFDAALDAVFARLSPLMDLKSGRLQLNTTQRGVSIYRVADAPGKSVYRVGTNTVNVPVSELRSMWIWEEYADWDKEFTSSSRVVETVHEHQRIVHIITRPKPMVKPRDFVFVSRDETLPDGTMRVVQSSLPAAAPPTRGCVRGDVCNVLEARPNGDSVEITYVTEFDPRGWIPLNVVNLAADEVCLTLNNFKTMAEEKWRRMQGGAASG